MTDDGSERRRVTQVILCRDFELAFLAAEVERGLLEGASVDAAADRAIRAMRADPALRRRFLRWVEASEREG